MYQFWCVLIIRMQHDNNVRLKFERAVVTAFLIAAITKIAVVQNDVFDADFLCYANGLIRAVVVNQNYVIDDVNGISAYVFNSVFSAL